MFDHADAPDAIRSPDLWDREYSDLHVIPSSGRVTPSKSLQLFDRLLDYRSVSRALDAGAGPGRNSIYLANKGCEVYSVDFSPVALAQLRSNIAVTKAARSIYPIRASLADTFPFRDQSFDLIIDSYVFCHAIRSDYQVHLREEFRRLSRPKGLIFSVVFSEDDEYYSRLIADGSGSGSIVTDPRNGITKYLHREEELKAFFSTTFFIRYFLKFEFDDYVQSERVRRTTFVMLMEA